ncbi:MAG TPA: 30S ribosomal protein S6 [Alphaproteobacteria bacterium]|nr:30S ribosomal protein S6 [Alphaproteobacteria bacterium]
MPFYEHVVIARPDISGQQAEALLEEMKGILAENGGSVSKTEYWGLRNLSYRIRKHRKGHYGLLNIDAPSAAVQELERRLKIHDDVIRFMSVRVEALDPGQSAPLQRGRDDRDRDGDRGGGRFGDRGGRGGGFRDRGDRDRGDRGDRGGFRDRDRGGREEESGEA